MTIREKKTCLIIGDSNYINKKKFTINGAQKNLCLGELIQFKLRKFKVNIVNSSVYGDTLIDVYKRIIFQNHILKINPEFIFIGLGTNDSNYFYSLEKFIVSPNLHYELLNSIIETLIKVYPNSRIYILPVPYILINSSHDLCQKRNSQIRLFNQKRLKLSKNYLNKVYFLSQFIIDPSKDLDIDGIHFNKKGILSLSEKISDYIINKL
tara:strand:+ start:79 stop:705 length:627 start_codon:yes stop_codon:yes gene_type:complete